MPSRFQDPCPLVCLEALSSGCAIIGSNRGGIPAICEGAAMVVEPRHENIAQAIQLLVNEPAKYAELRSKARQRACELEWSNQYQKLIRFVASVERTPRGVDQ